MPNKTLRRIVMLSCLALAGWHLASASWIFGKAYAATILIKDAWQTTLANQSDTRPWSWADTWPVAELEIPALGLHEIVLAGDSGASLAFGPGLSAAGASLDEAGVKLISAHRDTHFRRLQQLSVNDEIFIKTPSTQRRYKVEAISIVDSRTYRIDAANSGYDLVLATCYPFNTVVAGGSQRFIAQAREL